MHEIATVAAFRKFRSLYETLMQRRRRHRQRRQRRYALSKSY